MNELNDEQVWEDVLIEEVKSYPLLWDRSRRDYGHQEKCSVIWALISRSLNRPASQCMEKWKNLRDSYVRRLKCVRRLAYHGLTPRKPSWRYFEAMSFLDDHVNHRANQVDNGNDQPLPACSSKNVAFFDDGLSRAPNRNSLGGMGKKGPSQVRISSLPKQPVALFSRIGLGEISVIDDTSQQNSDQQGGHVGNHAEFRESALQNSTIQDPHLRAENFQIEESVLQIQDTGLQIEDADLQDGQLHQSQIIPQTDESLLQTEPQVVHIVIEENNSEKLKTHCKSDEIEATSERSRKSLPEGQVDQLFKGVIMSDGDVTTESDRLKTETLINTLKDEIRNGFTNINSKLDSLSGSDENFVLSAVQSLRRLPDDVRARTRVKIQEILREAETEVAKTALQSDYLSNTTILVQDGDTLVLCDGADFRTVKETQPSVDNS